MADKLIQTFTQIVTAGQTYVFTHSLTAAGVAVAPDDPSALLSGAVWSIAATVGVAQTRIVGVTTTLLSVAVDGSSGGGIGTVVAAAVKRHSIVNVT